MDEAFDSIIKTRTTIDKVKIYFGKNEQTNTNMLNCNITKENVDIAIGFIKNYLCVIFM